MKQDACATSITGFFLTWCAAPFLAACSSAPAAESSPSPETAAATAAVTPLAAQELEPTRLLQDPTISAEHIVFRYADDLWLVSRSGGDARRLTSSPGREYSPQLSPDGAWVAFTGQYEGNPDVYVISIEGGAPRRLTWHPGEDAVLDWQPDGSGILFRSARASEAPVPKVFLVSLEGGTPTELELPKVSHVSINDAATHFAYTPVRDAFGTWKRYRGGRVASVWIFDRATHEVEVVPRVHASDTFPRWVGDTVYFASDRDGVMNLYRFTPGGSDVEKLTEYTDFDIRSMDSGGGALVFEQANGLRVFDPAEGAVQDLAIYVRADGLAGLPRWQEVRGHVRAGAIAPNGKRAVFEARGEIISVPKEHGDARNLTRSPSVHERDPVWSPDGKQVAWLSDESGEYQLVVQDRLGRGEKKSFDLGPGGFFHDLDWSPDGEHILFNSKANRLAYLTLETGEVTDVASVQGSLGVVQPTAVWSPDSKWIAFDNRNPVTLYDHVALFELATGQTTAVTDDFAASASPAFSRNGKHLFFAASVNRGPSFQGLNMTTSAARNWDANLYVAVLQADGENPLFPKSDDAVEDEDEDEDEDEEESGEEEDEEEDGEAPDAEPAENAGGEDHALEDVTEGVEDEAEDGDEEEDQEAEEEPDTPAIDLEGLDQRILALPIGSGLFGTLACTEDKLLFVEISRGGDTTLKSFDFDSKEAKDLEKGIAGFAVSEDGKSLLAAKGGSFVITNASGGDAKTLGINSVKVRVEPEQEWPQILREAWRIERDYFYDVNMHGVDWPAIWERWQAFLPHVKHRSDLTLLLRELIGELACGHEYTGGGESPDAPEGVDVGLLGADFEVADGKYRIARILEGQNWNPRQRAPLTEPGVDANVGDYLIAVNDVQLDATMNLFEAFEYTSGKQTDLTLSASADGSEPRTVTVVPIGSERRLRYASWVEGNRKRVEELSGGRLAYIHMPDTGGGGMAAFDRDFYSQLGKEGVILDERYNRGGQVADYVIDVLSREVMSYWMNREEWLGRSPSGVIEGPKVMIINESAGSGGDWMPWAFKERKVGTLVGTRTWGGLVGISGYPPLMDGGMVTAANFGIMDTEGEWAVENVGVPPDVEIIEWPRQVLAGEDPQLDKAVEIALEQLGRMTKKPLPTYHAPTER